MSTPSLYRLVFYGDDFTGSTDALEVLAFAGLRGALFLKPPTPQMLDRFPRLDVVGVAGDSRAMTPEEMDLQLPAIFDALRALSAMIIHYKVCSTFDSSDAIGSIGRVMEIARRRFSDNPIAIVAGTPALGRYCLFGNLFARSGTDGNIYRIDRHPIMGVHPVTPMKEGDLAVHLWHQCNLSIAKFTFPHLDAGHMVASQEMGRLIEAGADVILFDAASPTHITEVGYLLDQAARAQAPQFVVGASGVEYALTQWWQEASEHKPDTSYFDSFDGVDRVLAISGSASMMSAQQISAALRSGFAEVAIESKDLVSDATWRAATAAISRQSIELLNQGRSVILHTACGPSDPRIGAMIDAMCAQGLSPHQARHEGGRSLGIRLGDIVRSILEAVPLRRILISGGDTASQVTKVLAPDALEIAARLAAGAPLCRAHWFGSGASLEIALKGGQMGGEHFFEEARRGRLTAASRSVSCKSK